MSDEAVSTPALATLSPREARVFEALAGRILPGDADDPGAIEAGVLTYVDRALAGPERRLRPLYAWGLEALDALARERYGAGLAELADPQVDALLAELDERYAAAAAESDEEAEIPEAAEPDRLAEFFAYACEHVLQGMLGDPSYGGNRDFCGWRLIGFPGARWGYSEEHAVAGFDASTLEPTGLDDLRRALGEGDGEG